MRNMWAPIAASIVGLVGHIIASYLFINYYEKDIVSIAVSFSVANLISLIFMCIHTSCIAEIKEAVFWPTYETFIGLGSYLSIAGPAILVVLTYAAS